MLPKNDSRCCLDNEEIKGEKGRIGEFWRLFQTSRLGTILVWVRIPAASVRWSIPTGRLGERKEIKNASLVLANVFYDPGLDN